MNKYLKKAEEFFLRGKVEYEEGLQENDVIKVREGCEKIFHALVELTNGVLVEHGVPIPEDHATRVENLVDYNGLNRLYGWTKDTLHSTCYYSGIIKQKQLTDAINAIEAEIKKRR
ncbi:MAG: hypothetical protein ACE5KT_10255 [Methanosarcinales archaeon]